MEKKEILKALEQHFGVKAKYMGAPSFAYKFEIGEKTFVIDRLGRITSIEGTEFDHERLINHEEKAAEHENTHFEVEIPIEGHNGATLRNLLNMIYSKQVLIKKVFELEDDILNKDFIIAINQIDIQTIEDFKTEVAEEDNIRGIKFDFNNNSIRFNFCTDPLESEKLEAYTQFIALLNKSAKELKHVSLKPTITDNEKYTFRCWMLRLGFIGSEYKASRKILLKNLEGNSAFRGK